MLLLMVTRSCSSRAGAFVQGHRGRRTPDKDDDEDSTGLRKVRHARHDHSGGDAGSLRNKEVGHVPEEDGAQTFNQPVRHDDWRDGSTRGEQRRGWIWHDQRRARLSGGREATSGGHAGGSRGGGRAHGGCARHWLVGMRPAALNSGICWRVAASAAAQQQVGAEFWRTGRARLSAHATARRSTTVRHRGEKPMSGRSSKPAGASPNQADYSPSTVERPSAAASSWNHI